MKTSKTKFFLLLAQLVQLVDHRTAALDSSFLVCGLPLSFRLLAEYVSAKLLPITATSYLIILVSLKFMILNIEYTANATVVNARR